MEDDYLRLLRIGTNGSNGDGMEIDESEPDDEEMDDDRPPKRVRIQ